MKESLVTELRYAYNHLYEWALLRKSPLVTLFDLEKHENPSRELGNLLTETIEALKPATGTNHNSKTWRLYQILYVRYVEQLSQNEAARDLGLSLRHLRREETLALEMTAAYLWDRYNLEEKWPGSVLKAPVVNLDEASPEIHMPDRDAEMSWLHQSIPNEPVNIKEMLENIVALVQPTYNANRIRVDLNLSEKLPLVSVQRVTLRQVLLGILHLAGETVHGGSIEIRAEIAPTQLTIIIEANPSDEFPAVGAENVEREDMLRQLIELSGGYLSIQMNIGGPVPVKAELSLPLKDLVKVMVVDDNLDTLQFIERCLTGTRYLFMAVNDPLLVVERASINQPDIILLDVMLPRMDGWELFERLKTYPTTQHIPIIVFSILPQEQVAKDLGAASFIRKPVSRQNLLSLLDQDLHLSGKQPN